MRRALVRSLTAASLLLAASANAQDRDPNNPTCPRNPDWSSNPRMELTTIERDGIKVLLAEGVIDSGLPGRLQSALDADPDISELWLRSPGGDAYAGNDAGRMIRTNYPGLVTRIPSGWACFSACNFIFMGGRIRIVEPGGHFIVHMFTHTGNREVIRQEVEQGTDSTVALIGEIEQSTAQLATEDNDFLIRMGVSRRLLSEVMYAQQGVARGADGSTRYCLNQEETQTYNVANVVE